MKVLFEMKKEGVSLEVTAKRLNHRKNMRSKKLYKQVKYMNPNTLGKKSNKTDNDEQGKERYLVLRYRNLYC